MGPGWTQIGSRMGSRMERQCRGGIFSHSLLCIVRPLGLLHKPLGAFYSLFRNLWSPRFRPVPVPLLFRYRSISSGAFPEQRVRVEAHV